MPEDHTVFLAPNIHLARCHDDIVVLDILGDDYALLTDAAAMIRFEPDPGRITVPRDVHDDLLAAGLLAAHPSPARFAPPEPVGDVPAWTDALPRRLLIGAAVNSLAASVSFARAPFDHLVATAARRSTPDRDVSDDEASRAIGAFLTIHPWIPFEGDCLQRGYRLHHHLHRSGIPARWVFGVRTWPFLAHCWVQVGDRVAGDTAERVRTFSPILAV